MSLRRPPIALLLPVSLVLLLTLAWLLLPSADRQAAETAPADGERIHVLTTFTILADMARNVAGDRAVVDSLIKPGAEIHGYEPTPQDIVRASKADLILWNGLNLEVWFEKFVVNAKGVRSVVLTEGVQPMPITEGPYTGKANPHAWMSPANALVYVDNIRAALSAADPANAAAYAANAATYAEKIRALDAPIRAQLARIPEHQRTLVTSEGAFSYLCRDYGMKQLYLWPINADAQGTPQQVRAVIDAVRDTRVPVVFSESTVSPKPALQVARETGARYGGLLYVDSLTDEKGPAPTYLALLETNARTIVNGFLGAEAPKTP
jgi:manganese/iron transport system substrate-binding protein